jgi:hypothetical protein
MQIENLFEWFIKSGATWGVRALGVLVALVVAHYLARWTQRGLVRVWCKTPKYWRVHEQIVQQLAKVLGARIPFPQMDVHFDEKLTAVLTSKRAA